jgi:hypothetical protein
MANPWNTLHIFGFGTVQAISDTQNVQAPYSAVKDLADLVVDNVWNKRPQGYAGQKSYHAINNFYELFSDWLPNQPNTESFRVQASDLDQQLLDDLAQAVLAYVAPTSTTTTTSTTTAAPSTSTTSSTTTKA